MSMLNPEDSLQEDPFQTSSTHQNHRTHYKIPMDLLNGNKNAFASSFTSQMDNNSFLTYSQQQREQAQLFFQTVSSYPSSSFVLEFVNTLQDILNKNCTSQDSLAKRFKAYIRPLAGFSSLDLLLISSLFSYHKKQINSWTEQKNRCIYYLYSPRIKQDSKNQYPPHLLGTVELLKITDSIDEEYKITFYSKKGKAISLYYDQWQFYAKEPIALCLQPTFSPKSHLTSNPKDHNLIPLLVGEIHGKKVLGVLNEQDLSSAPGSISSWYALWHPMHFLQWIHLFMDRIAIISSLDILLKAASFISKKLHKHATPDFVREQIYQEAKSVLHFLHKQAQSRQVHIKIPESSQLEVEIYHQKISLAALLAFQEGWIQKDQLEKQASQLEKHIKKELSSEKEEIVDLLSSSMHEIIKAVSQAFPSHPHPIEGFPRGGLERVIQKNKQAMEEVYQNLSRIHVNLITHLTEKKKVS